MRFLRRSMALVLLLTGCSTAIAVPPDRDFTWSPRPTVAWDSSLCWRLTSDDPIYSYTREAGPFAPSGMVEYDHGGWTGFGSFGDERSAGSLDGGYLWWTAARDSIEIAWSGGGVNGVMRARLGMRQGKFFGVQVLERVHRLPDYSWTRDTVARFEVAATKVRCDEAPPSYAE